MPTVTVPLNLTKPTVGGDKDVWGQYWNDNADKLNAIHTDSGTGTSVGMHVGTGKVLKVDGGTSDIVLPGQFDTQTLRLRDAADVTKIVDLKADKITAGATRTLSLPDENGTLATTASLMRLTSEALATGTASFLNVTFPVAARSVVLQWYLERSADASFQVQGSIAGVPQTGAHYHLGYLLSADEGTVTAGQGLDNPNWGLTSGAIQCWGNATFVLPSDGFGNGNFTVRDSGASRASYTVSFETDRSFSSFDGFYFSCGSGSLTTASVVRCFALV